MNATEADRQQALREAAILNEAARENRNLEYMWQPIQQDVEDRILELINDTYLDPEQQREVLAIMARFADEIEAPCQSEDAKDFERLLRTYARQICKAIMAAKAAGLETIHEQTE
jgi:hypothetical protein